jgi:hypothetical protein
MGTFLICTLQQWTPGCLVSKPETNCSVYMFTCHSVAKLLLAGLPIVLPHAGVITVWGAIRKFPDCYSCNCLCEGRWEGRPSSHFHKPVIASVCHVTPRCEHPLFLHGACLILCFVLSAMDGKISNMSATGFAWSSVNSLPQPLEMLLGFMVMIQKQSSNHHSGRANSHQEQKRRGRSGVQQRASSLFFSTWRSLFTMNLLLLTLQSTLTFKLTFWDSWEKMCSEKDGTLAQPQLAPSRQHTRPHIPENHRVCD